MAEGDSGLGGKPTNSEATTPVGGGLKPCPFCGTADYLSLVAPGSMTPDMPSRPYKVICSHLDHDTVEGPTDYGRTAAIAAWNRRLVSAPDREEIVASLRTMLALVLLKYGNLDPDVNVEVEKAQSILQQIAKLEGKS